MKTDRYTRKVFDQILSGECAIHALTTEEVITLRAALDEAADSIWSSVGSELATAHRRLRTIRFLRELFRGTLFENTLSHVLSVELWKTVDRTLPERLPEERLQILLRFFN